MVINSIRQLKTASPAEIEKARRSVSFSGPALQQITDDATRVGLTRSEYLAAVDAIEPIICPTCKGEGLLVPEGPRSVGSIHPSSAHKCVTRLYYDVVGEIAPIEALAPELFITFEIGHTVHRIVQKALHKVMEGMFEDEVEVNMTEALIEGGHTDGVGVFPLCRALLEIKTMGEDGFNKLTKPKEEDHLVQTHIYAKALDTPFIAFLYVSKGPKHPMKEFVVPYQERIYQEWYLKKAAKVEQGLEDGKPPKADATRYECDQCPYAHACPQKLGERRNPFRR